MASPEFSWLDVTSKAEPLALRAATCSQNQQQGKTRQTLASSPTDSCSDIPLKQKRSFVDVVCQIEVKPMHLRNLKPEIICTLVPVKCKS